MQPFFMANYQQQSFTKLKSNFELHSVAIISCEWNKEINDMMVKACEKVLTSFGVKTIKKYLVPGSFELPFAVNTIFQNNKVNAIICFGTIIKGDTNHDEILAHAVTNELIHLSTKLNIPIGLGVLTTNNTQQAIERANGTVANKGKECAEAVLKLIHLKENNIIESHG
jgi:6,7-dimethyl-8-ribityllumazine synthase